MALEGVEGSASHPGRSLPLGKTRYPLYRRLVEPQGRSGQMRNISSLLGFNPRTIQLVAIRYTDYATWHMECWCDTSLMLVCHLGDLRFFSSSVWRKIGDSVRSACSIPRTCGQVCIRHNVLRWDLIAITTHVLYLIVMASVTRIRTNVWGSCLHYACQCISSQLSAYGGKRLKQ